MPDMVQIGNEINGGMMWPVGALYAQGDAQIGGYDALGALLKAGVKAVRDADPNGADPKTRARIVIHLANGGDNGLYRTVFDALTARGVDFDVIGLSYYSYWHGALASLQANMNDISQRYHKDVAVVETAYAYTLADADLTTNLFGPNQVKDGRLPADGARPGDVGPRRHGGRGPGARRQGPRRLLLGAGLVRPQRRRLADGRGRRVGQPGHVRWPGRGPELDVRLPTRQARRAAALRSPRR